jgi:hypothetical protein
LLLPESASINKTILKSSKLHGKLMIESWQGDDLFHLQLVQHSQAAKFSQKTSVKRARFSTADMHRN